MSFQWLKRYMPRGLYGRAALILILPVVVVQLVVFVLFAQRHFTDVTEQMTSTMIRELSLVFDTIERTSEAADLQERLTARIGELGIGVQLVDPSTMPKEDRRLWYDFSGTVFAPMLRERFPQIRRILLADANNEDTWVVLFADTRHGLARLQLARNRLSASRPHQLYVNMVFFGVLMTAIAYVYLRNQLRPITRLAAAAEAFGRGQHMPYAPAGATEVRAAGTAFVEMRDRIERHIEQRTLMLSGVSHDLRTPLTRMRLALSMLEDPDREPLERDVEEMQRLVDEFLNFVQGAEGKAEPVDPVALVRSIVDDAGRTGRNAELVVAEGSGTVLLRETAIRRAVDNLISNAVRYGSRAEVSVLLSERALRIRVEDDGPGIPERQRPEAQKPFVRLDAARNQDLGAGVGLGLAIATDVARAHGGVLRLGESARLGGLCADIVIAR
jgi:two-component system osmolarity sensor histidine kinase EnvZ